MSGEKVASFDQIFAIKPTLQYATAEAYGQTFKLASLGAESMVDWLNEIKTPDGEKLSGLYLVARCIVDENDTRFSDEQRAGFLAQFRNMDGRENRKLIDVAQELVGVGKRREEDRKNDSAATPTAS